LEKEFKIDARGYRPQEVDKFLDMVIRDYTEYNSIIKFE
jgi:DivIVA domain-containing protein